MFAFFGAICFCTGTPRHEHAAPLPWRRRAVYTYRRYRLFEWPTRPSPAHAPIGSPDLPGGIISDCTLVVGGTSDGLERFGDGAVDEPYDSAVKTPHSTLIH